MLKYQQILKIFPNTTGMLKVKIQAFVLIQLHHSAICWVCIS